MRSEQGGGSERDVAMNGTVASMAGVSVEELEAAIARIGSVTAARVVLAPGGRIAEVHVLAQRSRTPKQIVRDIQSVALATFGVDVDYRTVSVVQLEESLVENDPVSGGPAPRVVLMRLSADSNGHAIDVRVHVSLEGKELIGATRGPVSSGMRLVARAVIDAVAPLAGDSALDVDFAEVVEAGPATVALAVLRLATARGDQVVSGSAVVRKDPNDAMARACLAALNRLVAPR